jgi:hypothetical protein
MITQKEANSIRRRLRSFVSSANAELSNLRKQPTPTLADVHKKQHIEGISSALLRSAEQLLELFNFICDGQSNDHLDRLLRTFELADSMFARHGSFMYRVLSQHAMRSNPSDTAWAGDRIKINDLLKPLVGQPDAKTPSVREVLRDGAFVATPASPRTAPATNTREAIDLLTRLETVLGAPKGSLTGKLIQSSPATTEEFTINTTAAANRLAEELGDPSDLEPEEIDAALTSAMQDLFAKTPGLNEAIANGTAKVIRII